MNKHTLLLPLLAALSPAVFAAPVVLQNATATYSQSVFGVGLAIDGSTSTGWAIDNNGTNAQTAVFEAANPLFSAEGFTVTISLVQAYDFHSLGRFRLSITSDDRSNFADGVGTGGDVTANWIVLSPSSVTATNGVMLSVLGDDSVLASGTRPTTTNYIFSALTGEIAITGFRLEVLTDSSLPTSGPGRNDNGNLVLSEFVVDVTPVAIPEPSAAATLAGLGAASLAALRRRARA